MKKIITVLLLLVVELMASNHTVIMLDGITVVVPLKEACKKRPQIISGTYLEKFYNIKGIGEEGDSWYRGECNWERTSKKCYIPKDENGEINAQDIRASSLKDHHTMSIDAVEGVVIIGCTMNSNYNLGSGFNGYNDFKLLLLEEGAIMGYAFSEFNGQDHWWLRTLGEIIKKENYPFSW